MTSAILGFLFITTAGTLLHFVYEWSGRRKWVALFGAVNESTWEHMKIAAIPALVWPVLEIPLFGNQPNWIPAKLAAVVTILLAIPFIFYSYTSLTRKSILALDIGLFVVSVGLGQWVSVLVMKSAPVPAWVTSVCFVLLVVLFAACLLLTLKPIRIFLFRDPVTGKYGLEASEPH